MDGQQLKLAGASARTCRRMLCKAFSAADGLCLQIDCICSHAESSAENHPEMLWSKLLLFSLSLFLDSSLLLTAMQVQGPVHAHA